MFIVQAIGDTFLKGKAMIVYFLIKVDCFGKKGK